MKRFFNKLAPIAAIMLLGSGHAMAQNDTILVHDLLLRVKPSVYISITGGASMPLGNFAKTDYNNSKSGFAATGFNLGINGTYMFSKHWGITGLASYTRYSSAGLENIAGGFVESFAVGDATVKVKDDNHTFSYLVGADYSVSFCHHISVDLRAMTGLVHAQLAGYEVRLEDNTDGTFQQKTATANTIGFQAGAAARYDFCKHVGVALNLDYYYSKPDFTIENVNRTNNAGRLLTSYSEPIAGINANLSLVYKFNRR